MPRATPPRYREPLSDPPTGEELRALKESRRRQRISASVSARYAINPLYRERVGAALAKHWDGNGKRLSGVWALRERCAALESALAEANARILELNQECSETRDA